MAFGGAQAYRGPSLRASHMRLLVRLNVSQKHFDAVVGQLLGSLADLGVAPQLVAGERGRPGCCLLWLQDCRGREGVLHCGECASGRRLRHDDRSAHLRATAGAVGAVGAAALTAPTFLPCSPALCTYRGRCCWDLLGGSLTQ